MMWRTVGRVGGGEINVGENVKEKVEEKNKRV